MTAKRHTGYDILRFVSICMVVVIHANVSFLGENQGSASWIAVMLITALCTLSVPLFFMLSGALLLQKEEAVSLKELYTKRIPKQAVPFILWSIIYVAARIVMGKIDFSLHAFVSLLWEPAYYQFWFMYTLLGIYLLLPILQILVKNLSKRMLEYLLLIWVAFSVAIPTTSYIIPQFQISNHVDLVLSGGYLGYFLLGHYLQKYGREILTKKAMLLFITGLAVILACAAGEWFLSEEGKYHGNFYHSYLTPGVVLGACGAFLLLQNARLPFGQKAEKAICAVSENAIGIYYIHMLVLTALDYVSVDGHLLFLVVKIAITIIASLAASLLLTHIPYVRYFLLGHSRKKVLTKENRT